jgi:integrase
VDLGVFVEPAAMSVNEYLDRCVMPPARASRAARLTVTPYCWSDTDVMPHGLIFEFALLTRMRPEEYLAPQWSDVDFERSTVQVRRALVRHKKSWSFEEPKTARSRRTVYLSSSLLKKLAAHKRKQSEVRL